MNAYYARPGTPETETICELACNLDDMTPEEIGFASAQLLDAGALDCYTIAIGMKKNRPRRDALLSLPGGRGGPLCRPAVCPHDDPRCAGAAGAAAGAAPQSGDGADAAGPCPLQVGQAGVARRSMTTWCASPSRLGGACMRSGRRSLPAWRLPEKRRHDEDGENTLF